MRTAASATSEGPPGGSEPGGRTRIVVALGVGQILSWGTSYYLLAVIGGPIARETGWSPAAVAGGVSWSLLVAAIVIPRVGRAIDRAGGRRVLATSSVLLAAGLAALGLAESLVVYYGAWTVLGLAMAMGLYDASMATLGRLFRAEARRAITGLTLMGGFASTVFWPVTTLLVGTLGWREACFIYAAIHLAIGLPIHWFLVPRPAPADGPGRGTASVRPASDDRPADGRGTVAPGTPRDEGWALAVLATIFAAQAAIASAMSVHLLDLLHRVGLSAAAAVAIGSLIGPSQVAGRIVEFTFLRSTHPLWVGRVSALLIPGSIAVLLAAGPPAAIVFAVLYGAGNGLLTIVKGTLPLAQFGAEGYATRVGRIAGPVLVAQAAAPIAAAASIETAGATPTLLAMAAVGAVAAIALFTLMRGPSRRRSGPG